MKEFQRVQVESGLYLKRSLNPDFVAVSPVFFSRCFNTQRTHFFASPPLTNRTDCFPGSYVF